MKKPMFIRFLSSVVMVLIAAAATALAQDATSLTLELPDYWGHLSYTITGARLDPPTGSDRGHQVDGRQYTGELTGNTLTISGNGSSDQVSRGPGSLDYFELVVSVTVGKEHKEYSYIAPKGEKLNQPFSLTVPVVAGESGSFSIGLFERNAYNGTYGWAVSGNLSKSVSVAPVGTRSTASPERTNSTNTLVKNLDVAMVTNANGSVTVQSVKEKYAAELAQTLQSGNIVSCGAGSTLSVIIIDSQTEFIARCPGRLVIGDDTVTGDLERAEPIASRLPKNLDLSGRQLADPGNNNAGVNRFPQSWPVSSNDGGTSFSVDEPVNRLIISNGRIGLVEVTRSGNGFTGRMNVTGKGWETLRNVILDSGTITFDRVTVPIEKYVGRFDNGSITGTFSAEGKGTRPWKAVIPEAPAKGTEALLKQGAAFAKAKKYDEALKTFDKALSIDPNNADALRQRAVAKRELKDLPGALEDFNSTIRIDPTKALAWVGRGITKERMKDVDGALVDYERAITLNPKYGNGYFYHGLLKLNQKDYQSAIVDFDRVIELEPANSGAYNNRGIAKAGAGNTAGATADYEKAIAINPNDETAKKNLAGLRLMPTTPAGVEKELFSNSNIYGVGNGGRSPLLEFTEAVTITYIMTYHWNSGRGAPTGTITLINEDGTIFGPWKASGTAGQGGVPSANWEVRPNIVIPAGRYQVIDSDPSTWAQNSQTGGKGFVVIKGFN